jgi:hypothetical protein
MVLIRKKIFLKLKFLYTKDLKKLGKLFKI